MTRSLILSKLRIELRRKQAGYSTEKTMIRWVNQFFDEMSITHSSQIRDWQRELFISNLQNDENTRYQDLLQAKSSLLFLFERVLKQTSGFSNRPEELDSEPGVFRITA
jgi:hypothetical protein